MGQTKIVAIIHAIQKLLDEIRLSRHVHFIHVKGHLGNIYNEIADLNEDGSVNIQDIIMLVGIITG